MIHMDRNPHVLKWASEELVIKYISPIDGKPHRYFPDLFCEIQKTDGSIEKLVIEIKPKKQTIKPKPPKKNPHKSRRFLKEAKQYSINAAKWDAAEKYCEQRGWKFRIMTEYDIYGKTGKKQYTKRKKD